MACRARRPSAPSSRRGSPGDQASAPRKRCSARSCWHRHCTEAGASGRACEEEGHIHVLRARRARRQARQRCTCMGRRMHGRARWAGARSAGPWTAAARRRRGRRAGSAHRCAAAPRRRPRRPPCARSGAAGRSLSLSLLGSMRWSFPAPFTMRWTLWLWLEHDSRKRCGTCKCARTGAAEQAGQRSVGQCAGMTRQGINWDVEQQCSGD